MVVSADGHILGAMLTPGNTADISVAQEMTEPILGCYVLADAGYDSDEFRDFLRGGGNIPVIPGRTNRIVPIIYDKVRYKLRRLIEQIFGWAKENKRLSVRCEKSDSAFLSMFGLAALKRHLC